MVVVRARVFHGTSPLSPAPTTTSQLPFYCEASEDEESTMKSKGEVMKYESGQEEGEEGEEGGGGGEEGESSSRSEEEVLRPPTKLGLYMLNESRKKEDGEEKGEERINREESGDQNEQRSEINRGRCISSTNSSIQKKKKKE